MPELTTFDLQTVDMKIHSFTVNAESIFNDVDTKGDLLCHLDQIEAQRQEDYLLLHK